MNEATQQIVGKEVGKLMDDADTGSHPYAEIIVSDRIYLVSVSRMK